MFSYIVSIIYTESIIGSISETLSESLNIYNIIHVYPINSFCKSPRKKIPSESVIKIMIFVYGDEAISQSDARCELAQIKNVVRDFTSISLLINSAMVF